MDIEIVVAGPLGELAAWAFADLVVEDRQVVLTSAEGVVPAIERLTSQGIDVVAVRTRPAAGEDRSTDTTSTRNG